MKFISEDTIAAPATLPGTGAISVVRLSGPATFSVLDQLIRVKSGDASSSDGYRIKYGLVTDADNSVLDEVLIALFRGPHSYTGEDMAEISCHASPYIVSRLLERLVAAGVRLAEPGEFTRRAFMNGRMDLAQAEAVADVIAADSQAAHRIAMNQLRGGFS
ncbi:MAG: tRNA uridine-5-carboxymethylaminomethyl(34) synthesis GTPase MnmE, partial [Bacteroidales bacterium]|nr:tRNA uridine-5-carboxymethylaminomethyl(34) synthesis GTPase MnmE [Bacteroidales bacterium]